MLKGIILIAIGTIALAQATIIDTICRDNAAEMTGAIADIMAFATERLADVAIADCALIDKLEDEIDANERVNFEVLPLSGTCDEVKKRCKSCDSGYYTLINQTEQVYCVLGPIPSPSPSPTPSSSSISSSSPTPTPSPNPGIIITHNCSGSGWRNVARLDMSKAGTNCPSVFKLYDVSGVKACGRKQLNQLGSCESITFATNKTFTEVCGKVIGYQWGSPDALDTGNDNIHSHYVDGISLTHGHQRQHIWTFIAARSEHDAICPCAENFTQTNLPDYVNNDYFCESGNPSNNVATKFYWNDKLWNGKECNSEEGPCCKVDDIPWFHKKLPAPTTDNIELRICSDWTDEDIPVAFYDIYVK